MFTKNWNEKNEHSANNHFSKIPQLNLNLENNGVDALVATLCKNSFRTAVAKRHNFPSVLMLGCLNFNF